MHVEGGYCHYCTLVKAAVSVVGNGDLKDDLRDSAKAFLMAEFTEMREREPDGEEETEDLDEGEEFHSNGETRPEPAEFR